MADEQPEEERERGGKVVALITKATNSTEPQVDPRLMKAIKMVVRYSDSELRLAVETLMSLMKRPHAQIRYLSLLIMDELFMRSKLFRTLITENMEQLLSLSVGFHRNHPLPDPQSVATVLRSKAIEFLEKWYHNFGVHYRKIRLGYEYLKNTRRFQFPNLQANAARVQQERREREMRTREILRSKFEALRDGLPSMRAEIKATIDEIGECLEIVKGNGEGGMDMELLDDEEEMGFEEIRNPELRQIRIDSLKEGEKVHENSENKVVFDALRELYKLLVTKHTVTVQEWLSVLIRVEVDVTRFRDSTLKEFIDFKNQIMATKLKCEESGCALPKVVVDEDDDIWEEGKIEHVEETKEITATPTTGAVLVNDASGGSNKSTRKETCNHNRKGAGDSDPLRSKLLAEAPVVNWGSALDNWGEKRDVLANQRGLELAAHWGRVDLDATIPAEKIAELNIQATVYKEERGEIPPCHAPLSNGRLCQRRDLKICPFHGPIIPRDDRGSPIHPIGHEGTSTDSMDIKGKSVTRRSRSPSTEEIFVEGQGTLEEKLARQAVKNVRERDKLEASKKEIDKRAAKRAWLAKIRQHNDEVLRQAAMASTSQSAAFGEPEGGSSAERATAKNKKPTLASMLRKKVTTKDRLSQKLLNTRVRDATVRQLTQGEDANYRESFPNSGSDYCLGFLLVNGMV